MASRRPTRRSHAAPLFGFDVFISFALGPAPRGSRAYASDLAGKLRERDFTVFFSEDEAPPGAQLDDTLRRALHRSRLLVVLANRGTLLEPRWVRVEVEEFRRKRPGRAVIPISFDGALGDVELGEAAHAWLDFRDRIWIDETAQAGIEGIASSDVIDRLATAPTAIRSAVRLRQTMGGLVLVFAALAGAALWWAVRADRAEIQAVSAAASEAQAASAARAAERKASDAAVAEAKAAQQARASASAAQAAQRAEKAQRELAEQRLRVAQARKLAADSGTSLVQEQSDRALLLAAAAWDAFPGSDAAAALQRALIRRPHIERYFSDSRGKAVAFAGPAQDLVSVADDGRLRWRERASGQVLAEGPQELGSGTPVRLTVGANGRLLAVSGRQRVQLWDAERRQALPLPIASPVGVPWVAISADGGWLATEGGRPGERALVFIDPATGLARRPPLPIDGDVLAFGFAGQARFLTLVRRSGKVTRVDLTGSSEETEVADLHQRVAVAVFAADTGRVALGAESGQTFTIDVGSAARATSPARALSTGLRAAPRAMALSPQGHELVVSTPEGEVILLRLADRTPTPENLAPARGARASTEVALSADGRVATTGFSEPTALYHLARPSPIAQPMPPWMATAQALAFSPDGRLAAASFGTGAVALWDARSGQRLQTLPDGPVDDPAFRLSFSADGRRLAVLTLYASRTYLWDVATRRLLGPVMGAGVLHPGGNLIALDGSIMDGTVQVVDLRQRRRVLHSFSAGQTMQYRSAFSPGGSRLAVAWADGKIRVWSMDQPKAAPLVLQGHDVGARALAFTHDGRLVSQVDDGAIVWTLTGQPRAERYRGDGSLRQGGLVTAIEVTRNNRLVALANDRSAQLWSLVDREPLGDPIRLPVAVNVKLAFTADDKQLAVAGAQGSPWLLDVDPLKWRQAACAVGGRNLSCDEWARFRQGEPYRALCPQHPAPKACSSR